MTISLIAVKEWQNETVSKEEEEFWIPLINAEIQTKNPNFSDIDRIRVYKWRIKKGKKRLKE